QRQLRAQLGVARDERIQRLRRRAARERDAETPACFGGLPRDRDEPLRGFAIQILGMRDDADLGCAHRSNCACSAAKRAAPSSAVSGFMMMRTGISASNELMRPLAVNARMKPPSRSLSTIFGAMPPPRYTPARARNLSATLPASA